MRPETIGPVKAHTIYKPQDRPEVEVLVDDAWHFGDLRQWFLDDEGGWHGEVRWSSADGNRIDTFPADRIRRNETDWSPAARRPVENPDATPA